MASHEKREFDKYLKFLTFKATHIIVQSRQGRKISTRSNPRGNDWFNLSIPDDKQVSSELKRSLEGRLPAPGQPVCVEILMDTAEGDSLVLEVWSIELDHSRRDVSVSVAHVLYPRLSLMLRSLVVLSRTTPAYRLSRSQEDSLKFTFRLYASSPDLNTEGNTHHCSIQARQENIHKIQPSRE
jgi:autophagy-related protein 13